MNGLLNILAILLAVGSVHVEAPAYPALDSNPKNDFYTLQVRLSYRPSLALGWLFSSVSCQLVTDRGTNSWALHGAFGKNCQDFSLAFDENLFKFRDDYIAHLNFYKVQIGSADVNRLHLQNSSSVMREMFCTVVGCTNRKESVKIVVGDCSENQRLNIFFDNDPKAQKSGTQITVPRKEVDKLWVQHPNGSRQKLGKFRKIERPDGSLYFACPPAR